MDSNLFLNLVSQIKIGKHLPDAIYLHKDAFKSLPYELVKFLPAVAKAVSLEDSCWDLVKLFKKEFRLSLLHYPDFYNDSYPALKQSVNVDLTKLSHKVMSYQQSENPPILHRKETMILSDNEYFQHFVDITQEGENAGLYQNTRIIGFKRSWENLIHKSGYELVDGRLFPSSTFPQKKNELIIERHKTAIVRHELSAPMKSLAKHGFLDGNYSIFDYGCGRGDDLRELEAHNIEALGWDLNFNPDADKVSSDIVNLGFVLNVIEDQDERLDALLNAWELTEKLLIVSVMLANENYILQFQRYKDGVITSRNTFQKYYAQSEIKSYIERSLQEEAIAISPGIFYVFKDKILEQAFIEKRYKRHFSWEQLTQPTKQSTEEKLRLIITQHQALFNAFWQRCLNLGRAPSKIEFTHTNEIKKLIGSNQKALKLLINLYDENEFDIANQKRKEDLLLYFSMELFSKRKPYIQQPNSLKRDIKYFFNNYKTALNLASSQLFQIADINKIDKACIQAHTDLPASILNADHSLIFHKNFINDLPHILRIYVGAGLQLYGELDDIDLIKIHITSGKLTLTGYDDFEKSIPFLKERIKIKMAEQDIDFFDYINEKKRPPLLNKSALIDYSFNKFKQQCTFDKRLSKLLNYENNKETLLSRVNFEEELMIKNIHFQNFRICTSKITNKT